MQVLALYYSKSENTEKLTRTVAEGIDEFAGIRNRMEGKAGAPDRKTGQNAAKLGRRVAGLCKKL